MWDCKIFLDFTKAYLLVDFKDTHKDFSVSGILYKEDQAIYLGNTCSFMGQIDNLNFYNIIFFNICFTFYEPTKKTATILLPSIIPWIDLSTKTLEEIRIACQIGAKDDSTVLNSFIGIKV